MQARPVPVRLLVLALSLTAFGAQAQIPHAPDSHAPDGPPAMQDSHDADDTSLPPVSDIYPQEMEPNTELPPPSAYAAPAAVPIMAAPVLPGPQSDAAPESDEAWSPSPVVNSVPVAPVPVPVQARPVPMPSLDGLGIYPAPEGEAPWRAEQVQAALGALPPQLPAALRPSLTQALAQEWPLVANGAAGDGSLLAKRAELLARWGSVEEAQRMLALISPTQGGEPLAWTRAEAAWLSGARADACAQMAAGEARFPGNPSSRWHMPGLLCRALDGRGAEAQLAIDLMDEQGQTPDPLVRHAIESLRLKRPLADMPGADPQNDVWNAIVLTEANGTKSLAASLTRIPVPLLRRIGTENTFDAALRKQAAGRLAQVEAGISPGEWLTPVRMEIPDDAPEWQRREAARTYALLQALGETVNPSLAATLGIVPGAPSPNENLAGFEAAVANHQPRRLLLQLAALLPPDLAAAEDGLLARLTHGLQAAGMRPLARQLAAESIAAIGAAARTEKPAVAAVKPPAAKAPVPAKVAPKPEAAPKKAIAPKPAAPKPAAPKAAPRAASKPQKDGAPSDLPKIDLP